MIGNKAEIEFMINSKIERISSIYGQHIKQKVIEILSLERMLHPKEKENRLIPLPMWNKYYDYPSIAGMRMKIFNQDNNGFKEFGVVHKEGKRVFINEQAYLKWQNRNSKNTID